MSKVIGKFRKNWKCAICGKKQHGYGNNPAPLMDYNSALVCDECNRNYVVEFRCLKSSRGENIYETIDRRWYNNLKAEYTMTGNKKLHPYIAFLDKYFKGTNIDKITDPVDYHDLVEAGGKKKDSATEEKVTISHEEFIQMMLEEPTDEENRQFESLMEELERENPEAFAMITGFAKELFSA